MTSNRSSDLSRSNVRAGRAIRQTTALTRLAIFPLDAIGITVMAPFTVDWDPLRRALVLTVVVVPLSVYLSSPGS
jgi:antibiotic biosynthesis monooxygenase (ABM) superfamily enzyme